MQVEYICFIEQKHDLRWALSKNNQINVECRNGKPLLTTRQRRYFTKGKLTKHYQHACLQAEILIR